MPAASKLAAHVSLQFNGHTVALEQVGPLVSHEHLWRSPFVSDDWLLTVLRQYGNVSHIEHVGYMC